MIQVNRIYLIFNRLVTKKFLVDTSDILHIYIRALLPYDCRSCNGCHHQYVFTNIVFIDFFCFIGGKDSANRMYNKMNLFIFYAEVQPVFVFATNISTLF